MDSKGRTSFERLLHCPGVWMKPAKAIEFLLPAGPPSAPTHRVALAASAGVVLSLGATCLRYLLSPFLPEWLQLSGLLLLISACAFSATNEHKYSPGNAYSYSLFPQPCSLPLRLFLAEHQHATWQFVQALCQTNNTDCHNI